MTSPTAIPTTTKRFTVSTKPGGEKVTPTHFLLDPSFPISSDPAETANKILVKVQYISVDAGQRTWMDTGPFVHRSYLPPVMEPHMTVFGGAVGTVVVSHHPDYRAGDTVFGHFGWTQYSLWDPALFPITKVPPTLSPQEFIVLELASQAAYFGFVIHGRPEEKKGGTVVVSAAAGGVGLLVCQLAKRVFGMRVVGVVGSEEKRRRLEALRYCDVVVNYKDPEFEKKFEEATKDWIDIYFDNVGGKVLDLSMRRIALEGKIIACGAISYYEREQKPEFNAESYMQIIYQNASIHGMIVTNWYHEIPRMLEDMQKWHAEGKLDYLYEEQELPFEELPEGLRHLLDGKNFGKTIIKLKEEDAHSHL